MTTSLRDYWSWLVKPGLSIKESDKIRNSKLLAAIFLITAPIMITYAIIIVLIYPPQTISGIMEVSGGIVSFLFWLIAYFLNRFGSYVPATLLLVIGIIVGVVIIGIPYDEDYKLSILFFMIISVYIAGIFLNVKSMIFFTFTNIGIILVLPLFFTNLSYDSYFSIPIIFILITSVLLIFGFYHRNNLEEDRKKIIIENESRLRAIFDSATSVSFITTDLQDDKSKIIEFSKGSEKIFGYKRNEIIGKPVSLLHTQEDVSIFPKIQNAVRKKKEGFHGEITLVRKTGETFPALFTVKPLYSKDGKVTASMGISVDISELKLAQQLQIENKSLEEINKLKNEFMANMSHELRTPLNSIIGFSELMISKQFGELTKKQQKHVENIHNNGESLLSLINDVLDISKIESGKLDINYEHLKLDDILKDIEISFQPLIKIKKQKLEIIAEKGITITTDPRRIKQCINNILSNAIKYTQNNGKIVITAIKNNNIIEFSIKDNGIGIPSNKIKDVFKPFFKIPTTDNDYDSAGLGLNITKTIIEAMNGQIWVESEEGKGSTFYFNIPAN